MIHWLSHLWNDPISAKEQFFASMVFFVVIMIPIGIISGVIRARNSEL